MAILLDHHIAVAPELALPLAHHLAHGVMAGHDGHHPVDAGFADRGRDVGAADPDPVVLGEEDGLLTRELREPLRVAEVEPALHRQPGERPVHRASVEVAEAERGRRREFTLTTNPDAPGLAPLDQRERPAAPAPPRGRAARPRVPGRNPPTRLVPRAEPRGKVGARRRRKEDPGGEAQTAADHAREAPRGLHPPRPQGSGHHGRLPAAPHPAGGALRLRAPI